MRITTKKNKRRYSIKGGSGKGKRPRTRTRTRTRPRTPSRSPPRNKEDRIETGLIPIPTKQKQSQRTIFNIEPETIGPISGVSSNIIYDRITGGPMINRSVNAMFPFTPPRKRNTPEIIETPESQKSDDNMSFSEIFNSQGTPVGSRINSVNSSPIPISGNIIDETNYIRIPGSAVADYSINTENDLAGNPDSNRFGKGGKKTGKKRRKKTRKRNKK